MIISMRNTRAHKLNEIKTRKRVFAEQQQTGGDFVCGMQLHANDKITQLDSKRWDGGAVFN